MTESSIWWTTGGAGDGSAPYTQAQVTAWLARMLGGDGIARGWPLSGSNELTPSVSGTTVNVAPGAALVQGIPYESTTTVSVSVPTPLIGTTGHRIVLRADYAARTVRIALKSSNDGVAVIPALTQSLNTTWELALASVTITTGGTITLTDQRTWLVYNTNHVRRAGDTMTGTLTVPAVIGANPLRLDGTTAGAPANNRIMQWFITSAGTIVGQLVNDAVSAYTAWIEVVRSGQTVSQINFPSGGDTVRSGGNPVLHTGNMALRVVTGWLADAAVTTAKIADGAVTLAKWANPPRRQGGNGTNWSVPGINNYTPPAMRMQVGVVAMSLTGTPTWTEEIVTFPTGFLSVPIILVSVTAKNTTYPAGPMATVNVRTSTGSHMEIELKDTGTTGTRTYNVAWIAVGP